MANHSGSDDAGVKWTGSSGVITKLGDIASAIGGISTDINNAFSGEDFATIQTTMDSHLDSIDNSYDTVSEREVAGPLDGALIEVPFLATVGPKSTSTTVTGGVKAGFDSVIGGILSTLNSMKSASTTVQSTTSTIATSMNNAIPDVQKIEDNFSDFGGTFIDNSNTIDPYLEVVRLAFLIAYIVIMAFVGMGLVGVILVKVCRMDCCRFLNHIGWCCTSLMLILSLLLGIILWGVGLTLSDSCLALDNLVTPTDLQRIDKIKDSA